MGWVKKLKSGLSLRKSVDNDDIESTIKSLVLVWKEINTSLAKAEVKRLEKKIESGSFTESYVNKKLAQLYNYCDSMGYWIEIQK